MSGVVADTHAVLWYLAADPRLSLRAKEAMEKVTGEGSPILIPTICLVEAIYLVEKNRVQASAFSRLVAALREPGSAFEPIPLSAEIAFALREIPRASVPDLPDRVIAATALALQLPLVTRDGKIRASGVETIW
ncbi:MAG: type II toxin-antitoxin system VapC family toxin [Bryobacteraceae bacterium]